MICQKNIPVRFLLSNLFDDIFLKFAFIFREVFLYDCQKWNNKLIIRKSKKAILRGATFDTDVFPSNINQVYILQFK